MRIPSCRTDEVYNQNRLVGADKEFLKGFDWCTEIAVDNFFNNFEDMLDDYMVKVLNEKLPEHHNNYGETYTMEFVFGNKEEERKVETYADLLRMQLLAFVEMDRDALITSMIDHMEEDE